MVPNYFSIKLDGATAHIHTYPYTTSTYVVLFLLHGHPSSSQHMNPVIDSVFELITKKAEIASDCLKRKLMIVTLDTDLKAHGAELEEPESGRLYQQHERMAAKVSSLINTLPAVIGLSDGHIIDMWMVAGLSLGAHVAWLVMDRDPRLIACIPILGSPDFLDISTAGKNPTGVPLISSYILPITRDYILGLDPVSRPRTPSHKILLINKHILALSGAQDSMVALPPTREFLDRIDVGPMGTKKIVVQEGVGHQCTREMVEEMAELIWKIAFQ